MKRVLPLLFVILFVNSKAYTQKAEVFTPLNFEEADQKADSLFRLMTLEEKINYIGGSSIFYSQEIKRLDIPWVAFVDATQGVRINPAIICKDRKKPLKKSIAYPSPILLASTWNVDLTYQYANSIGQEARSGNLPILLGPGFNMYRNSQCGRNFEYMGEDPFLTGNLVANYVVGLQETGTIATLKHFVANQTEYYRRKSNTLIDERTLHEIYLPPFKYGIDAGAKAVMTSYNLVNGEWPGQSEYIINTILREELGFKWLVMTDWFSVWDGEKVIKSGQDIEMPFRKATKDAARLLEEGTVTEADIDRMVKSTLRTFISMKSFEGEKQDLSKEDYKRLEEVALKTAREGIVLLKNNKQVLPIDKSKNQKILVTGKYLEERIRGGGAGSVKGYDNITVKDALKAEFGKQLTFIKQPSTQEVKEADIVLLSVGTSDREAVDRPFDLPEDQEALVQLCTANNPNTVVIVTSGGGINMSRWNGANTILYTWYMGQNGANAVSEILSGKVNPSGKLPISIEKRFEDSPAYGYIPDGEELYKRFKMRKENKREVYDVNYHEGIFVGYRWYEHRNIEPEFCFGHGLSYTSFTYTDIWISSPRISNEDDLEVKVKIQNTGSIGGAEIVQLYIADLQCTVERPVKELKGFDKVYLEAGESQVISFTLNPKDFAFWHPETKQWTIEEGDFEILIGASSADIRGKEKVSLK